jgi:hypothetical protein
MRLITWNCCRGTYARKAPLLDTLAPDIAVIQECAKPIVESPSCLWFGDNPKQGIAIQASGPYRLHALPVLPDAPKFVIPVSVSGPRDFTMFAVWTLGKQPYRYVEAAAKAVDMYRGEIAASPTVMIGDFNSNTIWDATHPREFNHSSLVRRLHELKLVSAYHYYRDEEHGHESQPTFFLHWKKARPYHIDYCFLPEAWAKCIRHVEVGSFEDWNAFSDHRPLLVEIDDAKV